jgi:hypothetical protein
MRSRGTSCQLIPRQDLRDSRRCGYPERTLQSCHRCCGQCFQRDSTPIRIFQFGARYFAVPARAGHAFGGTPIWGKGSGRYSPAIAARRMSAGDHPARWASNTCSGSKNTPIGFAANSDDVRIQWGLAMPAMACGHRGRAIPLNSPPSPVWRPACWCCGTAARSAFPRARHHARLLLRAWRPWR